MHQYLYIRPVMEIKEDSRMIDLEISFDKHLKLLEELPTFIVTLRANYLNLFEQNKRVIKEYKNQLEIIEKLNEIIKIQANNLNELNKQNF